MPDDTDNWFCVDADTGDIFFLGNHGDFEAAEDTAQSLGLNSVWTFGEQTARHWQKQLSRHLKTIDSTFLPG